MGSFKFPGKGEKLATTVMRGAVVTTQGLPCGDWKFLKSGKVAETYLTSDGNLAVVRTDRVSAFDVVMPTPIPDRGMVLHKFSAFWCNLTRDIVPNHMVRDLRSVDVPHEAFAGRTMLVQRLDPVKIEAIVRGYLYGSAWSEYRKSRTMCGRLMPKGMAQAQKLRNPMFTPSTKAEQGHDENISYARMIEVLREKHGLTRDVARVLARKIKDVSLALYSFASGYANLEGILVVDTKFEFGLSKGWEQATPETIGDHLFLIDEVLTPDSSRFWWEKDYKVGGDVPSLDKQQLREWLEKSDWNKEPPAPELPQELITHIRAIYIEAYETLTGQILH